MSIISEIVTDRAISSKFRVPYTLDIVPLKRFNFPNFALIFKTKWPHFSKLLISPLLVFFCGVAQNSGVFLSCFYFLFFLH